MRGRSRRPRTAMFVVVGALWALACAQLLVGCGGEHTGAGGEGAPPGGGTKATKTYVPPAPLPPPVQSPTAPPVLGAHVARVEGDVHIAAATGRGEALAAGGSLLPGVWVETGPDGAVVLDFRREGRVEIDAGTLFAIGADRPMELIVSQGGVRMTLPPAGNSSRPSLRVATAELVAEIPGSGDAYVSVVDAAPPTRVYALSGTTETSDGGLAADGACVRTFVPPGQATSDARTLVEGALTVNAARAEHVERARRPARRIAGPPPWTDSLVRLDEAVAAVEAEAARGAALDAAHRAAVASNAPDARDALLAIARHSQATVRLSEALLVRWERAQAALDPQGAAELASRAARVRAALPGAP